MYVVVVEEFGCPCPDCVSLFLHFPVVGSATEIVKLRTFLLAATEFCAARVARLCAPALPEDHSSARVCPVLAGLLAY
jgi:hypothetical protein